jgi:hypothetical protein
MPPPVVPGMFKELINACLVVSWMLCAAKKFIADKTVVYSEGLVTLITTS